MNEVLETSEWVARRSLHVRIDEEALIRFCRELIRNDPPIPPWEGGIHFFDGGIKTVAYFLVLDTLNFCFWPLPGTPRWEITVDSEPFSGYYGLAACLKRAVRSGTPLDSAEYLASMNLAELKKVLEGRGELQLMGDRLRSLQELGRVLLGSFGGEAWKLVDAAGGSALELARLLARNLQSFKDEAVYQGKKVFFHKRAQILAADLFGGFQGKKWGGFSDMELLTAFPDYKLPQVLRHLGIFQYTEELARKIDSMSLIPAGSPEEIEIRANTVWAVELLREELGRSGQKRRAYEIDWILWNLGQDDAFREKPYHRTVTIFY
ncbi:MAG: hypothetical protein CVU64_09975 [Deltaproteobacteria bacterium HGW-Deltaproteobacteria-21]|nr:MAG: hypothetical protein CVU64_09975 [Deltaproteobacteria bacterium HGW-Deltaproteobacteria-21]